MLIGEEEEKVRLLSYMTNIIESVFCLKKFFYQCYTICVGVHVLRPSSPVDFDKIQENYKYPNSPLQYELGGVGLFGTREIRDNDA